MSPSRLLGHQPMQHGCSAGSEWSGDKDPSGEESLQLPKKVS